MRLLLRAALACWATLLGSLAPAQPRSSNAILELPNGKVNRLASPDRQYVLYLKWDHGNPNTGPELWIENRRTADRTIVLALGRTARAAWSADSTSFYVNDELASSETLSYLYDPSTLTRVNIQKRIVAADPEAPRLENAHAYFEVQRWESSRSVLVDLFGHNDVPPVRCFKRCYRVSRAGKVQKLGGRTMAVTDRACRA